VVSHGRTHLPANYSGSISRDEIDANQSPG
jgi:hypothetical protein